MELKIHKVACGFSRNNVKVRPMHDGMPLSQEFKIRARRYLPSNKTLEISVPYRVRVGDAEINTWGDGLLNLRRLFWLRFGLFSKSSPWGKEEN